MERADEALPLFERSLSIRENLASIDASDAASQFDLALARNNLGYFHEQLGNFDEAIREYEFALEICQRLAEQDPESPIWRLECTNANGTIGMAHLLAHDFSAAIDRFRANVDTLDCLIAESGGDETLQFHRGLWQSRLDEARMQSIVFGELSILLEQPAELLPDMLEMRGLEFARRGELEAAVESAETLIDRENADARHLYNAACIYALCASALDGGEALPDERVVRRDEWISQALDCLDAAIDTGFADFALLRSDPDLAVWRDQPEFEELLRTPPAPPLAEAAR
jgi:tetratricopeptide (TPR) repeat protein